MKIKDWQELTGMTRGEAIIIERVRLPESDIVIEGCFEPPPLVRLSADDQVFVMAFIRSEGVIKEMEKIFGVSYPTIKSRLARISAQLRFVETVPDSQKQEIIDSLERGQITAKEAIERLLK